jgi:hypothetical protein
VVLPPAAAVVVWCALAVDAQGAVLLSWRGLHTRRRRAVCGAAGVGARGLEGFRRVAVPVDGHVVRRREASHEAQPAPCSSLTSTAARRQTCWR